MKIERLRIENLRGIRDLELDLRDEFGVPRDLVVLVGPNGCGKTTILDAISLALTGPTELTSHRADLDFTLRSLVRAGGPRAVVELDLLFSEDERAATSSLQELPLDDFPERVHVQWTFPDKRLPRGRAKVATPGERALLNATVSVVRRARTEPALWPLLRRVGKAILFDQRRTGLERRLSPDVGRLLGKEGRSDNKSSNTREILLDLAIRAQMKGASLDLVDAWSSLKQRFQTICGDKEILQPVSLPDGSIDMSFREGAIEYGFEGLSSGELILLSFLVRLSTERAHRSVILVDEVELHLHPIWQRRFLYALPEMGEDNQVIVTTHSDYLRDAAHPSSIVQLGALLERA